MKSHRKLEIETHNTFKRTMYALIRLVIFLLILCICFIIVSNITKRKYSSQAMSDFINQDENFDVLFFGSSHVMNGIFPMDLWNDYGIISYNMGKNGERITVSYHNMLLACKQTKPKLIVIDTFLMDYDEMIDKNKEYYLHDSLDVYPISYTKYAAIKDIFDGNNLLNREVEFLFNFSMYHTRWNELTENDFFTSK